MTTVGDGSLSSVTVTVNETQAPFDHVASVVTPDGHVIVGGFVSFPRKVVFGGPPFASAGASPTPKPTATHAAAATKLFSDVRPMTGSSFRTSVAGSARPAAAAAGHLQRRNPGAVPLTGPTTSPPPDLEDGGKRR